MATSLRRRPARAFIIIHGHAMGVLVAASVSLAHPAVASELRPSLQPVEWDSGLKLAELADINPDPRIVEINLEARLATVDIATGTKVEAWTYNGRLPGPLIRTRVGDRLVVHFTNALPQPTTVHWHGVRVPIEMDGVPGYSQEPVKTGGEFTYDFTVPDAGLYWYHPHVMSAAQVGFGLYGALLVEDPNDGVNVADELVLVLSDIGFDEHGHLEDPNSGGTTGMAFGREGNAVLINGRTTPSITARAGAPQRWRIVNTAKSRYFVLDLEGHTFTIIGGDGGLQEYATQAQSFQLAPGERVDMIVTPRGKPGSEIVLKSFLPNRGYGTLTYRPAEEELLKIRLSDMAVYAEPPAATGTRAIRPVNAEGAKQVTLNLGIKQLADGSFEYGINGIPYEKAKPFLAAPGETQIWTLVNDTPWSHPFHLHGFFFQVLDKKGLPGRPLVWKDTVDVPFKQSVQLIVRFDEDRPGNWMMHCHILDHADGGLMGTVQVGIPPSGTEFTPHSHGEHP